ncbi:hypothetical protein [Palleronia sp.]|uniref:hypothetical protein n=1 Tax=Palleronia sp. TaxID=1940284 RepID=UPI0035C8103A
MLRSLTLALALGAATPAAAFIAQNGLIVAPTGSDTFHVPWTGRSGAPAYWCAADDYVVRKLHLPPPGTKIYRYDRPMRRQGEGIAFDLDPARAQPTGLLLLQGGPGFSASFARTLCDETGVR